MRLNKFIAQAGYCSRRKADQLIEDGQVFINGTPAVLGQPVETTTDTVIIGDETIVLPTEFTTILLHKPEHYITTKSDPQAGQTIYDLLPKKFHHLHPIGRLDKQTEGLIILTNDGDLTHKLSHPRNDSSKKYFVKVIGYPSKERVNQIKEGIEIEEEKDGEKSIYKTRPCEIKNLEGNTFEVLLKEGRNRQIRKMFNSIGHPVIYLKRLSMGPYELSDIPKGNWRIIGEKK